MEQPRIERRLTAILATDVVGYSRLMSLDEVGTLRALKAFRKELFDPLLAAHHGRIVKTTGDGVLAEFPSAVEAVASAVATQRAMISRNASIQQDRRIELRMGINVGDVIIDGDDIHGDGVNIAARLEALSEPGGICISGTAYDQVRDKLPFAFADRGEQMVKNIPHPVRVYALGADAVAALGDAPVSIEAAQTRRPLASRRTWQGGVGIAAAVLLTAAVWFATQPVKIPPPSPSAAPRWSIVVLPFANMSGDPSQDYLADILTEELTTSLSRLRGSFVIARSTAFTYKGKSVDVKQIGRELGIRYVIEGSERHGDNRVRANAQLIDAENGAHLWADQFDADRADVAQMQDDIVMRIARALQMQLVTIEAARVARAHAANPDAEDLAMRCEATMLGSHALVQAEPGFALCERALQIDKDNVRALANLAHKFAWRLISMRSVDLEADIKRADELASRALQLDPNYYLAHNAKALVLLGQKRHQEALAEAERTLALNPSYIPAYVGLCSAYFRMGRLEKLLEECDKAIRLGPRDPALWHSYNWKANAYFALHQDDQAIEWWQRGLTAAPDFPYMQAALAAVFALNDRDAEARGMLTRYLSNSDARLRSVAQWRADMKAASDNPVWLAFADRIIEGLRKAGMPEE